MQFFVLMTCYRTGQLMQVRVCIKFPKVEKDNALPDFVILRVKDAVSPRSCKRVTPLPSRVLIAITNKHMDLPILTANYRLIALLIIEVTWKTNLSSDFFRRNSVFVECYLAAAMQLLLFCEAHEFWQCPEGLPCIITGLCLSC